MKICRFLVISFICITLSCANINLLNLSIYANNQIENLTVKKTIKNEERKEDDKKAAGSGLEDGAPVLPTKAEPIVEMGKSAKNVEIAEFDTTKTEVSVKTGTSKEDIPLPQKLTATLRDGEKADIPVAWDDGKLYKMDTRGAYTFTADMGDYTYAGEKPIAVVTVMEDAVPLEVPLEEQLEVQKQQEQVETSAIVIPFTLGQTPEIASTILMNSANKVVLINEENSVQSAYSTLQEAMQAIGTISGGHTIVFVQDYLFTPSDKKAVSENGKNAQLTVTSTYKNNSNAMITKNIDCSAADTWTSNSDTTFKDISFSTYLHIYGNFHKLTIDAGVTCASADGVIYGGGSADETGNVDITILSGRWDSVISSDFPQTVKGNSTINIGGKAVITSSISAAADATGKVTVNLDGTGGATVQSFSENTAAGELSIHLKNAKIMGDLFLGNAKNLNISGECIVGNSITAKTTDSSTINLSDGASLSNGTSGSFNCPDTNLVFGADSKLYCNGMNNKINNIFMEGGGATLYVKKGEPMTVSGTCTGKDKLDVAFINDISPVPYDKFLTFTTRENANKDNYEYSKSNGYDGIVTVNGNVVYFDFVPPEGYVYDWYGTKSISVGGQNTTQSDDLKFQFQLKDSMDQEAFRLSSGQLSAKIKGLRGGKAFKTYYKDDVPNFKYTIKVGSDVYNLFSNAIGEHGVAPSAAFRGYKKSADGSNLDLVFYLGRDVGIVYLHLTITPGSKVMSESWDYVNLSNNTQDIIVSHGGRVTFAGWEKANTRSDKGSGVASILYWTGEPAMFMWVDQHTTPNPAVAGEYSDHDNSVSLDVRNGTLFSNAIPKTDRSYTGIKTELGIQWQYSVDPGATQSASGGTAFGSSDWFQVIGRDVTFKNPINEESKTVSHIVINNYGSDRVMSEENWEIEGLPDEIRVTNFPYNMVIPSKGIKNIALTYTVSSLARSGTYPVKYTSKWGYTFTDIITVIRDEVKITAVVKNEDNTNNTSAISEITSSAMSPFDGSPIYKYDRGRLSWTLDSIGHEIKKITVGGRELNSEELVLAKANNYLVFDKMTEDKDVVIYVREKTNKVTVSKTVAGGSGGESFSFTITVKDKEGLVMPEGTELSCMGATITGSQASAPTRTKLILDKSGQTEFNLGNGQTLEIMGIPAEGKIQVVEGPVTGYEAVHMVDGNTSAAADQKDTGLLDMKSMDKHIVFYNTHLDDLTVGKTVEGVFGDKSKRFSFQISVKDNAGGNVTKTFGYDGGVLTGSKYKGVTAPASGTLSVSNGVGSFTLKHGQSITIKHLDPTYKIQITETDPGTSYNTKHIKDGEEADGRTVRAFSLGGKNAEIVYTNARVLVPVTGIRDGSHTLLPVLGAVLEGCAILGFVANRLRRKRQYG